jgi:hypothetical protein
MDHDDAGGASQETVMKAVFTLAALWLTGCGCGDEGTLTIATSTLPDGVVGVTYRAQLEVEDGGDVYWGFASGRLPAGLTLSETGALAGTPTGAGDFAFRVRAISTEGSTGEKDLTLHVEEGESTIELTTEELPEGRVGEAYSVRLEAEGGVEPYAFGIASGALPPGLSLSERGLLSGTPEDGVDTTLTIRIFDAGGGSGSGQLHLVVIGASGDPRFESDLLDSGRVGEGYSYELEASGGQPPYVFTNVGRTLPDGLALSEDGRLTGDPEEGGVFELRFRVTDERGRTGERDFYLPITSRLVLATESLRAGLVGEPYDERLDADGGMPPYVFSIDSGDLPEGLTLEDDGRIHGTPSAGVAQAVRFRVTDTEGYATVKSISVRVYSFPVVEAFPDLPLPGTCDIEGEESIIAEIPVALPGMVTELDVGAAITFENLSYLTVALESPTGRRAVLYFGDQMDGGDDDIDDLDAFWDEEDVPSTPLDVFRGEPTQGVWRLVATVTMSAWGTCTAGGSIDHVFLALTTEASSDPYVRVSGWSTNNLIQYPWVRITGGGLDQDELQFSVRQWSTGANGVAEGGFGDDEDMGEADLDWSTTVDAEAGTISGTGLFSSGGETGFGTVTGTDGETDYTFDMAVVPPDWVP